MGNYNKDNEIVIHPSDHKNKKDWADIFDFLDKNLDYSSVQDALDLGAGMSNIGAHILKNNPDCHVVSIDNNDYDLSESRKLIESIEVLKHDINKLFPFGDESFDFVSCLGTLHYGYINTPKEVIEEMIRVSRKYILVDFFSKNSLYNFLLRLRHPAYSARMYSKKNVEELIASSGNLDIVSVMGGRTFFPRLFPYSGKEVFYLLEKV